MYYFSFQKQFISILFSLVICYFILYLIFILFYTRIVVGYLFISVRMYVNIYTLSKVSHNRKDLNFFVIDILTTPKKSYLILTCSSSSRSKWFGCCCGFCCGGNFCFTFRSNLLKMKKSNELVSSLTN